MTFDVTELLANVGGDPADYLVAADAFLLAGNKHLAASALDRAYGLAPDDTGIARQRAAILDELAVTIAGLAFRYVPAGTFAMGSDHGDPDERPVHLRRLDAFWITDAPLSWTSFCAVAGYTAPPEGRSPNHALIAPAARFIEAERRKLRLQYCADEDKAAADWHQNAANPPIGWSRKPMVSVASDDVVAVTNRLASIDGATYALPTEPEWEKAARGGRSGARYAWGDGPPTGKNCDFYRMGDYRLLDPRRFPANGYGLHGMCGGVWELTADRYDALAYLRAANGDLTQVTSTGADHPFVIRGGSFTDCAASVTVSFRASRPELVDFLGTPNIGLRLVRRVTQCSELGPEARDEDRPRRRP